MRRVSDRLVGVVTKLDFLGADLPSCSACTRKLTIQFGTKGVDVTEDQQAFMMNEFDSFSHRFQEAFQLGTLFVYMKSHGDIRRPRNPTRPLPIAVPNGPRHILRSKRRLGRRTHVPRRTCPPRTQTLTQQGTLSLQPKIRQGLLAQNWATFRRRINLFFLLFVFSTVFKRCGRVFLGSLMDRLVSFSYSTCFPNRFHLLGIASLGLPVLRCL